MRDGSGGPREHTASDEELFNSLQCEIVSSPVSGSIEGLLRLMEA